MMIRSEKTITFERIRYVIGLLMIVALAGCAAPSSLNLLGIAWDRLTGPQPLKRISIIADEQANNASPVAVDIVIVRERKVFDILSNLRAGEWFNAKSDLLRQYQQRLVVYSWEIVPGQKIERPEPLNNQREIVGTLIFADYAGDKAYRSDISGTKTVRVQLGRDDFSVNPN